MVPDSSTAHYARQQHLAVAVLIAARREWARLGTGQDFDVAWRQAGPRILALVVAAQRVAAVDAFGYIGRAVAELGLTDDLVAQIAPTAFAGVASDGRALDTLLYEPVIRAKESIAAGAKPSAAVLMGRHLLDMLIETQIADAGRAASSVAITARPRVTGWVRMLQLPSCSRCVVLAGAFYRWNQGFRRHPRCDCRHIPATEAVAGDLTLDPRAAIESGQVRGLSEADRKAIVEDGADVGQVINAHRAMQTVTVFGRTVKATSEGTTRRGFAFSRLADGGSVTEAAGTATRLTRDGPAERLITRTRARVPRLRPEEIYRIAGDDRTEAIRLLTRFGYLI